MPKFFWDVQQGSKQWYDLRAGRPTASEMHRVITPKTMKASEQRKAYACQLIAQRLLNWQVDSLDKIAHVAEGRATEPLAVAAMELAFDLKTEPVGFVLSSDGRFGASPDRVSGVNFDRTAVSITTEVKAPTIPVQMQRLIFGDDDAYRVQRQSQLWIAEADKAIFFSYNPRMPAYLVEDGRDEKFIAALADCLERFSDELEAWTEQARRLGDWQAFEQLVTPVEAERATNLRTGPPMSEEELDALLHTEHYKWGG